MGGFGKCCGNWAQECFFCKRGFCLQLLRFFCFDESVVDDLFGISLEDEVFLDLVFCRSLLEFFPYCFDECLDVITWNKS